MLAQMMKAMHRHGCADFTLALQAEQLLRDDALQEYSNAFTPDQKSQDRSSEFVPESVSKLQNYTKTLTHKIISKASGMPNQNADGNQAVIPLEEHGGIQVTQPPVALGQNEDLDITEVRTTNMCQFKLKCLYLL